MNKLHSRCQGYDLLQINQEFNVCVLKWLQLFCTVYFNLLRILVAIPNHESIVVAGNYSWQSPCVVFSCSLGLSQRCQVLTIAQFREVVRGKFDVDGRGSRGTITAEEVGSHVVSWNFASVGHQELDAHQVGEAMLAARGRRKRSFLLLLLFSLAHFILIAPLFYSWLLCTCTCQKLIEKVLFVTTLFCCEILAGTCVCAFLSWTACFCDSHSYHSLPLLFFLPATINWSCLCQCFHPRSSALRCLRQHALGWKWRSMWLP